MCEGGVTCKDLYARLGAGAGARATRWPAWTAHESQTPTGSRAPSAVATALDGGGTSDRELAAAASAGYCGRLGVPWIVGLLMELTQREGVATAVALQENAKLAGEVLNAVREQGFSDEPALPSGPTARRVARSLWRAVMEARPGVPHTVLLQVLEKVLGEVIACFDVEGVPGPVPRKRPRASGRASARSAAASRTPTPRGALAGTSRPGKALRKARTGSQPQAA